MKFQPSLPRFSHSFAPKMVYFEKIIIFSKAQMEWEECSIRIVRPFQTLLLSFWRASLLGPPDGGSSVSPQVPASAPCGGSERRWDRGHQPTRTCPDFHLHGNAIRRRHSLSEHRRTEISYLASAATARTFISRTFIFYWARFHNRPLQFYLKCPVLFPRSWEMCNLKAKCINWRCSLAIF